jgi:hypothetical protein
MNTQAVPKKVKSYNLSLNDNRPSIGELNQTRN